MLDEDLIVLYSYEDLIVDVLYSAEGPDYLCTLLKT